MKFPALLLLLSLGLGCLGLMGCGQKGPLFLPSEQPEQGTGDKANVSPEEKTPADAP